MKFYITKKKLSASESLPVRGAWIEITKKPGMK